MRTVSDFLSRAGVTLTSDAFSTPATKQQSADRRDDNSKTTFADVGARIGEDNEALRNLLIDTGHQFSAVDDLKETFGKLVEPLSRLLTTLEHERADNAGLRGALAEIRTSHETLRTEFQGLGKRSSELESDNERLARDLDTAQQTVRQLEDDKAKLGSEIAAMRVAMAKLESQLGDETSSVRALSDEKGILAERSDAADKRINELEAEVALARERLSLLENDKDTLQAALDRTLAESSRTSRRLAESEGALSDARGRLQQVESSLAAVEAERKRLAAACDEANEQRQSEVYALVLKLDAMRSRSDAAEKLLAEVRQNLVARTEEIRVAESKIVEATVARSGAEKKFEHVSAVSEGRDRQTKKLEQARANLTERCNVLSETLKASESSLGHAQEKVRSLTGRVEQLQSDAAANQAKAEKRIEQLNAAIERERVERALAEGALETTRGDYARVQREMSVERSTRRRGASPKEVFDGGEAREPRPPHLVGRSGNGENGAEGKPDNGADEPVITP
jgi:chromosome segregation ATPase